MAFYANETGCSIVASLLPALGGICIIWRFAFRARRNVSAGIDDWICVASFPFVATCGVIIIVGVVRGEVGSHSSLTTTSERLGGTERLFYAFIIPSYVALALVKLSFLFFYRRIFRGPVFEIVSWVTINLVILWMLAFATLFALTCLPPHAHQRSWDLVESWRVRAFVQNVAGGILDMAFDLVIILLPIGMVVRSQMKVQNKLMVGAVALIGAFSLIAGACRLMISIYLAFHDDPRHGQVLGVAYTDEIAQDSALMFCTMIEIGGGLVAACIPSMGIISTSKKLFSYAWYSLLTRIPKSSMSIKAVSKTFPALQTQNSAAQSSASSLELSIGI